MTDKRATVFGGSGYLGRAVVRRLVAEGWSVRIAVRRPDVVERLFDRAPPASVETVAADLLDDASVAAALIGSSAAVNCVGLYRERGDYSFEAVHVAGAERVARAAAQAGTGNLVHLSGIGADPVSWSAYVRDRARGEAAVHRAFPQAVILRPSALFGPGDAFLTPLASLLKILPVFPLFGDGGTRLQPVLVDDVAEAVARVLAIGEAVHPVYELGGGEVIRFRDLIVALQRRLGIRRLLLPVPFALWRFLAVLGRPFPFAPITDSQVALMENDNIVGAGVGTFADLGIEPAGFSEWIAGADLN